MARCPLRRSRPLDAAGKSFVVCSRMTEAAPYQSQRQELAELRTVMDRQLEVLGRLAEAGLNLAIGLEQQAKDAPEAQAPNLALAYARVSRAVRLTIALQSKVIAEVRALSEVADRYGVADANTAARAHKARVVRVLDRVIGAEARDDAEVDRLAEEACERLEHDDIYGDLQRYSPGEIVALLCRDLGLAPDWSRWAQEAWAQDEVRSGAAGSPFTRLKWTGPPARHAAADPDPADPQAASP